MEAKKKKEAAVKAVKLQEERDKNKKELMQGYYKSNILTRKFMK